MLADKDIESALAPLMELNASWYIGQLDVPRAADNEQIKSVLVGQQKVLDFASVNDAYQHALDSSEKEDMLVVFGSFYTVAEVLQLNTEDK